jgi:flagellar operon protein
MAGNINNISQAAASLQAGVSLQPKVSRTTAGALSFNAILEANLTKDVSLKFSAHAQERLSSRNIALNGQDLSRLEQGVAKVAQKGSRESLVMKDGVGFVVSVTNRTVITAVDLATSKDSVFTNIDSAIVV